MANSFHICLSTEAARILPRRARKVFVSGLAFDLTEEVVRRDFARCGEVTAVRLPKGRGGRPLGHAFVEHRTSDGAAAALRWDGTSYAGRVIKVERAQT